LRDFSLPFTAAQPALTALLGEQSPLKKKLSAFTPRPQQIAMAQAIAEAFEKKALLLVEAETGTGKTFAYLLPALFSPTPVVIATASIALQEQLFQRDLPTLSEALGLVPSVALLKGRHRYLCRARLQETQANPRKYQKESWWPKVQAVAEWQESSPAATFSGDLTQYPEELEAWPPLIRRLTASGDNCYGRLCPEFSRCHVVKARQQALEADIVIVNHHLLAAHFSLQDRQLGRFLPEKANIIIDEAHHFPETLALFFGERLSLQQINDLQNTVSEEILHCQADSQSISNLSLLQSLEQSANALWQDAEGLRQQLAIGSGSLVSQGNSPFQLTLKRCQQGFATLLPKLKSAAEDQGHSPEQQERFKHLFDRATLQAASIDKLAEQSPDYALWYSRQGQHIELYRTPMALAAEAWQQDIPALIFTSATLAIRDDFTFFAERLGLKANSFNTLSLKSPFDYQKQALLYQPPLPEPDSPQFLPALLQLLPDILAASRGRALLLFTSHAALQTVSRELPPLLAKRQLTYPILMQGQKNKWQLLQDFQQHGNAILLATQSFWEGVDIPGAALSCVIIDKLPFTSPGNPLQAARLHFLKAQGREPFRDYQLPQAILSLKQGIGRLIRQQTDRGIIVIADSRLYSRSYGKSILQDLPPMPQVRDLAALQAFFAEENSEDTEKPVKVTMIRNKKSKR
jgi:ATP-dependent DNA helicase DinG